MNLKKLKYTIKYVLTAKYVLYKRTEINVIHEKSS